MAEVNVDGQVLHVSAFKTVLANTLCIIILARPGNLLCERAHEGYCWINPSPAEGKPAAITLVT